MKGATGADAGRVAGVLISIHAPVKGATEILPRTGEGERISIHAPVKGATIATNHFNPTPWHFNPRSREGSDRSATIPMASRDDFNPRSREGSDLHHRACLHADAISIHAPVKGATTSDIDTTSDTVFQSTLP